MMDCGAELCPNWTGQGCACEVLGLTVTDREQAHDFGCSDVPPTVVHIRQRTPEEIIQKQEDAIVALTAQLAAVKRVLRRAERNKDIDMLRGIFGLD